MLILHHATPAPPREYLNPCTPLPHNPPPPVHHNPPPPPCIHACSCSCLVLFCSPFAAPCSRQETTRQPSTLTTQPSGSTGKYLRILCEIMENFVWGPYCREPWHMFTSNLGCTCTSMVDHNHLVQNLVIICSWLKRNIYVDAKHQCRVVASNFVVLTDF